MIKIDKMDSDYLLKALDNENNTGIEQLSSKKMKAMKNDYLQQLQFPYKIKRLSFCR